MSLSFCALLPMFSGISRIPIAFLLVLAPQLIWLISLLVTEHIIFRIITNQQCRFRKPGNARSHYIIPFAERLQQSNHDSLADMI